MKSSGGRKLERWMSWVDSSATPMQKASRIIGSIAFVLFAWAMDTH